MRKLQTVAAILMAGMASLAVCAAEKKSGDQAQEGKSTLVEARAQIEAVIAEPSKMAAVTKDLSAADQLQFLSDVNKAIADMPASIEEKTGKFLEVNRAALSVAAEGNVAAMTAEMFATVSPEALPALVESLSSDMFNRSSDSNKNLTDAQFVEASKKVMEAVNERCESTDNGSPRTAMAVVMMVRGSNGTIPDLADTLIDTMKHEDAKELAKNEWVPSALGADGREQSYDSIMASADAGKRPDMAYVLVLPAGSLYHAGTLGDVLGKVGDPSAMINASTPILDAIENPLPNTAPTMGADTPGDAAQAGGAAAKPQTGADKTTDPTFISDRKINENNGEADPQEYVGQLTGGSL